MAYHSWQNKSPSKEFDEGHAATFGEKADPFCSGCGRLPHFCECKFVEVATKAHAAGKDCNMLVPGAGGLEAWLPDLSSPEKVAEHARALEEKLGPLTRDP